MVEDLLTTVITLAGTMTGMAIKYGALLSLPTLVGTMAAAPITLLAAGLAAAATIGSALIFVGIFK